MHKSYVAALNLFNLKTREIFSIINPVNNCSRDGILPVYEAQGMVYGGWAGVGSEPSC